MVVRDYLRTIEERQLRQFGIAFGDETFIHIWYASDLSDRDEHLMYQIYYRKNYPQAMFLLYHDEQMHSVNCGDFFNQINSWKDAHLREKGNA